MKNYDQNYAQIGENRRLDWSQGLLGEDLGVILGPKAAWDRKTGPGGKICTSLGRPIEIPFAFKMSKNLLRIIQILHDIEALQKLPKSREHGIPRTRKSRFSLEMGITFQKLP